MASSLQVTIKAAILAVFRPSVTRGSEVFNSPSVPDITMENGTGSGQADLMYSAERTLTSAATETLDLYGGLTDPSGATLNFVKVKALRIKSKSTNTTSLTVGNAASNPFVGPLGGTTPTVTVGPGETLLWDGHLAGWAIANGSTDNLKVANGSGASATYEIDIIGTSA